MKIYIIYIISIIAVTTCCYTQTPSFPNCKSSTDPGFCVPLIINSANVGNENCDRSNDVSSSNKTFRCTNEPTESDYITNNWSSCGTVSICIKNYDVFEEYSIGKKAELDACDNATEDFNIQNVMNDVLQKWKNVCSGYSSGASKFIFQTSPCTDEFHNLPDCTVQIDLAVTTDQWYDTPTTLPVNDVAGVTDATTWSTKKKRINLNFTEEFLITKGDRRWSTGGGCQKIDGKWRCPNINYESECIDIEAVLLHEIGHIFGLHHSFYCSGPCHTERDDNIMYGAIGTDFAHSLELGECDKCSFCALWCPDKCGYDISTNLRSPLWVNPRAPSIKIYPNPTNNNIIIALNMGEPKGRVRVLDEVGQEIESLPIDDVYKDIQYELNMSNYSSGRYYIVAENEFGFNSRTVILVR